MLTPAYAGGYIQAFLQGGNPAAAVSAVWSDIEFEAIDPSSAVIIPRVFDDCPSSTLTTLNAYPALISIDDSVLDCFGFANLHVWRFSEDGATPRMFDNANIFSFSADLMLTGTADGEAGLQISPWWSPEVDGRFNVRTSDGEIACFGGRLPFYSFTGSDGVTYVKGTSIHLSISYTPNLLTEDYPGTVVYGLEYQGMSYSSGPLPFDMGNPNEDPPHGLWGILSPAYAGGHFQPFLQGGNAEAALHATWSNISFDEQFPQVVDLDIKPGSCPNPLNIKSKGVTPVAILGTEDFDVSAIDPATVRLMGLKSKRSSYEDVASPYMGEDPCGCSYSDGDGIMDMTLKFSSAALVEALLPISEDEVVLTVSGLLLDGTPFTGQDCVSLKPTNWVDDETDPESKVRFGLMPTSEPRASVQVVQYAIPEQSRVELKVYDVAGRVVKHLVQSDQPSGEYTTQWDVRDVPSGIYFYHLQAGNRATTQKALVIH
jgi:hypothetical protein